VVASTPIMVAGDSFVLVSIPFIAGQWSLLGVVLLALQPGEISIPFIAGQWSLRSRFADRRGRSRPISIPFIAGQWSLRSPGSRTRCMPSYFNPLHCGAVVASIIGDGGFDIRLSHFNPLHCGAVVASRRRPQPITTGPRDFNPLHCGAVVASNAWEPDELHALIFQSPSLRGSGRFAGRWTRRCAGETGDFNPLHCGAVVASWIAALALVLVLVFNPLHCGAVVASGWDRRRPPARGGFQSPSLRGSGRFRVCWRFCRRLLRVSIPFIAGQWSLHQRPFA